MRPAGFSSNTNRAEGPGVSSTRSPLRKLKPGRSRKLALLLVEKVIAPPPGKKTASMSSVGNKLSASSAKIVSLRKRFTLAPSPRLPSARLALAPGMISIKSPSSNSVSKPTIVAGPPVEIIRLPSPRTWTASMFSFPPAKMASESNSVAVRVTKSYETKSPLPNDSTPSVTCGVPTLPGNRAGPSVERIKCPLSGSIDTASMSSFPTALKVIDVESKTRKFFSEKNNVALPVAGLYSIKSPLPKVSALSPSTAAPPVEISRLPLDKTCAASMFSRMRSGSTDVSRIVSPSSLSPNAPGLAPEPPLGSIVTSTAFSPKPPTPNWLMTRNWPAPMIVPSGKRYFRRLSPSSLRYQPPMLIGWLVVFNSSIQSPCGPSVWVRISLISIAPGSGWVFGSAAPGEPNSSLLGRHDRLSSRSANVSASSRRLSVKPSPSVMSNQPSLKRKLASSWLNWFSSVSRSPLLRSAPLNTPAILLSLTPG